VKQADTAEYDYHTVFKLSWKEQMPVRQIHFIGRGIIHVLADNKPVASANVLAEDNEQIRYVYLYNICSELTLDVYSNQPIDYKSLKLQIIRGSLTYGRRAIASSCWPENSHLFTPDQALDYFDTFWNAQPDFPSEEYLVVKERPDVHRIREYKIEGMNCAGELVLLTEFQGDMNREAITHIIPDIYINRLRLTILKTETDNYGFSEPGISRFEAYYCPCLL
jgi:hypothetical protein